MLLAIDIGNSNVVLSIWNGKKWEATSRITSKNEQGSSKEDKYHEFITAYFSDNKPIDTVIISSVVPDLTDIIQDICSKNLKAHIMLVDFNMKSPLCSPPSELGQDLFANAVASYTKSNFVMKRSVISTNKTIPTASLTVDLGTALTFTAVNSQGEIAGVAISTGIESSFKALVGNTAQLSEYKLYIPESALGLNTHESLNSGIMLGYRHLIKGMVAQIKSELNENTKVFATGGLSGLMKTLAPPYDTIFDEINLYHTLDGLRILAEYNSN